MENLPFLHGQKAGWNAIPRPYGIVDQRPWTTARTLTALAVSAEELQLAREAERLADHEVDQNFAQSLRQASAETRQLTGEALSLQQRVTELQQTVAEDQERIAALTTKAAALTAAAAPASAGAVEPVGDDLDVAKAQLSLDQDELSDSTDELARASGDHRGEIQRELSARQAEMKKYDLQATGGQGQAAVVSAGQHTTLAGQMVEWWAQRSRKQLIQQAEQLARSDVAALTADRARLQQEAQTSEANAAAKAAGESSAARVKELQSLATQRTVLKQNPRRRAGGAAAVGCALRPLGRPGTAATQDHAPPDAAPLSLIAAIVLLTILAGWALQVAFDRMTRDRSQRQTLRIILNLSTQVIGLLLVLLVIFGLPGGRRRPSSAWLRRG